MSRALSALLEELRAKRVDLKLDGEQLRLQAPKGVLTPQLQQELRQQKGELLRFLRAARSSRTPTSPLGPRARNGRIPLSYAQEGAWLVDRLQPGTAFNILMPFRMTARFHEEDVRAIFTDVTARHDSLRTRFGESEGVPYQIVEDHIRVPIDMVDLREASPKVRNELLRDTISHQSRVQFDLEQGPLIRVTVVLMGERDFVVLPVVHHIVFDGWSVGVFQRDLAHLYRARVSSQALELPRLQVQYPDYALWEREVLSRELFNEQLAYWLSRLEDAPAHLDLAHDLLPTRELFQGDIVSVKLSPRVVEQLRALARAEGVTLFMLLLGAFRALLMRYTGQDDVIIGTTVAQRSQQVMADVIGFCVNVVPLRTEMSGNPTFRELLARERRTCLEAYENQDLPFGQLVRALSPDRRVGDSPMYRAQFALWDQPPPGAGFEGMPTAQLFDSANDLDELDKGIANLLPAFDELSLYGVENASGFSLAMHYRKDLFDPQSMLGMLKQMRTFLERVAAEPGTTLWEVPLLDPAALRRVCTLWPGELVPVPAESVLDLFERGAAAAPDAVAVTEPGAGPGKSQSFTYAELNRQANRLAHHLMRQGLGPEQPVGICLEKSVRAIVSMLGVMKAGLAFVPLDPAQGPVRLRRMIQKAGVELAVAKRDLVPESVFEGVSVIDPDGIGSAGESNPQVHIDPERLAYVVFTSGSTGEPKGVLVTHGSLGGAYRAWEKAYDLATVRTHLQMAGVAFDVFVGDLVRALCSGGHLVLCPRETLLDPRELYGLLSRYRVEIAEFVPAVVRSLVDYAGRRDLRLDFMKLILVGSDYWSAGEYLALKQLAGDSTRVINSYGVAEATIDSSYYEAGGEMPANRVLPVGRPFEGSLLYVLDSRLGPAGPGVPGELYLGGSGVARGYVGDPALTAARLVPNPYSGLPGDRLYRTGDRARWRADGQLEFLGRLDDQVKVRGFRIEPGEVEKALSTQPAVEECVVVARSEGDGEERHLVAYVVLDEAQRLPGADLDVSLLAGNKQPEDLHQRWAAVLRRHVRELLPEYMVPAAMVFLHRLPLTPNGKVDRRGLPAPDRSGAVTDRLPLTSPAELALGEIYREVLGVQFAGAGSDFFALGGHSLKAAQIVHRVRERLNVELPLRSVFEMPVLADLAAHIDGARTAQASLPPIRPVPIEGPAPLSYAQEGAWFLDQLQPGALFNVALPFHLRGPLDVDALRRALARLVARHEVLRTVFTSDDGVPGQVILPPMDPAFEVVDRRHLHGRERDEALLGDLAKRSSESFDMEHGPLFKTHLIRLSDDEQVLLMVAHHIVFDGYSAGILGRDLAALYESHRSGEPAQLPHLPIQYRDYAVWQREVLSGEYLEQHLDFWRRKLDGCPPGLNLPSEPALRDTPRGTDAALLGLSKSFSDSLRRLCEREGVSLFMLLGAAFKALLSRYTGQEDIVVGTPVATRGQPEMADVIGFCVNVLALRTDLSGNPTFRELLRREKVVCLDAYSHQELPFGLMVQKLHPDRHLDRSPFFSVGFGLLQAPSAGGLPQFESDALLGIDRQTWMTKLAPHADAVQTRDHMFLQIVDTGAEISAALEHSSSMFAPETIGQMLRHFELLLQAMEENPDARLRELELDSLPAKPGGKVDVEALPDAEIGPAGLEAEYVAPRTPDELVLSRIWAEVLGVERVGVYDHFVDLGGHSLLATRLVARVRAQLEVDLPLRALFQDPTVSGMAQAVDRIRTSGPQGEEVDLEAEARLAEDIRPVGGHAVPVGEAHNILVTGATGFLGAYLVRELLLQTTADIYCLVRAENAGEAAQRIRRSLEEYGLWDDVYRDRIRPLAGALDRERLGLDEAGYEELAHRIDAVVHNAAVVGTGHSYGMLRAANVAGTENVLRFACRGKDKPVHHVSTLSVFPGGRWAGGAIGEELKVDPAGLAGGYPMSKWVAEQLVLEAGERGLPVAIYRPGRIVKDSGPGPLPPTDLAGIANLNWLLELGSVPPVEDTPALDLVPVDYVARAIVRLALDPRSPGRAFHLNNPSLASFSDVVDAFRRAGYRLDETGPKQWAVEFYRRLGDAPPPGAQDAVNYIPPAFRDVLQRWRHEVDRGEHVITDFAALEESAAAARSRVDCRQTLSLLEGTGIVCPPTAELLPVFVEYLRSGGLVQPPGGLQPAPEDRT